MRFLFRMVWNKVKVNVKLSLCLTKHHAMKTYWGIGGISPRILNLGIRWRWVVSFTPRPIYSRVNSLLYPLDRRLGGSHPFKKGYCIWIQEKGISIAVHCYSGWNCLATSRGRARMRVCVCARAWLKRLVSLLLVLVLGIDSKPSKIRRRTTNVLLSPSVRFTSYSCPFYPCHMCMRKTTYIEFLFCDIKNRLFQFYFPVFHKRCPSVSYDTCFINPGIIKVWHSAVAWWRPRALPIASKHLHLYQF